MKILSLLRQSIFAKVSIATLLMLLIALAALFYYLTYNVVATNNESMKITAELTAQSVIDKVDRNFYERFGDVQAFAFNRLAVETAEKDSVAPRTQTFINTMTAYYVLYDLMMICDRNGKVLVVNTTNKLGEPIHSGNVMATNMANETWFNVCVSPQGPKGGAWFSDFMVNPLVAEIYGTDGYGMAFAAPIKNDAGEVIGVWYNYASWREVTEDIRIEAEHNLLKSHPESFIVLTKETGEVISAENKELMKATVEGDTVTVTALQFANESRALTSYNQGQAKSHGAYTFEGKGWKAYTFIPKSFVTWHVFFSGKSFPAVVASILIMLAISLFIYFFFKNNILKRLNRIRTIQEQLSKGELVNIETEERDDEIGKMMQSLSTLAVNIQHKAAFADEIAKGNLTANLSNINAGDILGNSLVNMRNQLHISIEAEKQRNWATEGLAQIGTLLRSSQSTTDLYNSIIQFVVRYVKANQGGLFLLEENNGERYLSLVASYAYNKKRFVTKTFDVGQGIIGQAIVEKGLIYMTDIPHDYVQITSGLGDANPRSIVVIPLKTNEDVLGAIEIASFSTFSKYELEFLEKLAEDIASSIGSVTNNERTREMVQQLQQQTEEMKSQEEEMRQNMEELSATQEEMMRKEQEYIARIRMLENKS